MRENQNREQELYDAVVKLDVDAVKELTSDTFNLKHWSFKEWHELLCDSLNPLEKAIQMGNLNIVEILLQTPVGYQNSKKEFILDGIVFASFCGNKKILEALMNYFEGKIDNTYNIIESSLYSASEGGNVEIAKIFIEMKAQLNSFGESGKPLMIAAEKGHIDVVRLLVESGANVDKIEPRYDLDDSAVRLAVINEHWDIVEYLISFIKNSTDKRYAKRNLARIKDKLP
ncbi:ankyrin repeat-containing protein [Calothrix parasitica NIES-267]|uniref:Ankyrin repeat-containing protein n=1 Tax=Calothrix parasitica NIES-267 TaxID=1973488 RepID=A0A1Z4LVS9_9CYAN|nr:ankyrin repeat-containing protein [Calothrix parasitica NIES-267]